MEGKELTNIFLNGNLSVGLCEEHKRGRLNHEVLSMMQIHEVGATKLIRPSPVKLRLHHTVASCDFCGGLRAAELRQHVHVISK